MANTKKGTLVVGQLNGWEGWIDIPFEDYDKVIFCGNKTEYDRDKYAASVAYTNLIRLLNAKKNMPDKIVLLVGPADIKYFPEFNPYLDNQQFSDHIERNFSACFRSYNKGLFQYCYQHNAHICVHGGFTKKCIEDITPKLVSLGLGLSNLSFGNMINLFWKSPIIKWLLVDDYDDEALMYATYSAYDYTNTSPLDTNWVSPKQVIPGAIHQIVTCSKTKDIKTVLSGAESNNTGSITNINCIDHNTTFEKQRKNFLVLH